MRRPRIRNGLIFAAVLLAAPALSAQSTFAATTAAEPRLRSAAVVLPPGEQPNPDLFISRIECPAAGICYAGGSYDNRATGSMKPFLDVLSQGRWSYVPIRLPSSIANANVAALDCPQVGECVAVVQSQRSPDPTGPDAFALILHAGTWTQRALPAKVQWSQVTCPLAQQCVFYGRTDTNYLQRFLFLTGSTFTPQAGAVIPGADLGVVINTGLTCTSTTFCVESGFVNEDAGGFAYAEVLSNGRWKATALPVPADGTGPSNVESMTCSSPGSCTGFGSYMIADGTSRVLAVTLSNGSWTAAAVPLPTAVTDALHGEPLAPVACATTSSCAGLASPASAGGPTDGVVVTAFGGTIAAHTIVHSANDYVQLNLVTCSVTDRCLATGYVYRGSTSGPTYQGFVALATGDGGFDVVDVPGPVDNPDAYTTVGTVGCTPSGKFCVVGSGIQGARSVTGYFVTVRS